MDTIPNNGPAPTKRKRKTILYYRLKIGQHHFNKWLDATSIHGIIHVFKGTSRFRRILWLLIFLVAVIGCVGVLGYDIAIWAGDPSTTTISSESNPDGQSFPAVTFCNLNPVRRFSAPHETVQLLSMLAIPTSGFIRDWPYSQSNKSCSDNLNALPSDARRDTLWNAYNDGGHQVDEFVVYCGFASENGTIVRCESALEPILTPLGLCYTFNSAYNGQPDLKVTRAGPMFGLNLVLNVSQSEYSELSRSNVGVKVSVHARDTLPVPHETGLTLSPGTNSYVTVETVKNIDARRASPCIKYNRSLAFFPNYSYAVPTCRVNALYEEYAQETKCDCSPTIDRPLEGEFVNTRNCTVADICCLLRENSNFDPSDECPPSCQYLSYNVQSSYSLFPSTELAQEIARLNDVTPEDVRSNLLSLYVYFDDMEVTQLNTEYSYTFANLLADMGGLLGLFIGASVISLLEVAMLVFDFLKSLMFNPKMKKAFKDLEKKIALPDVELKGPLEHEEDAGDLSIKDYDIFNPK